MSTKRNPLGQYIFSCHHPDCGAEFRSHSTSVKQAWHEAKMAGWIGAKIGNVFYHWCSWVHRPHRDKDIKP